jgi:hypothetical protein
MKQRLKEASLSISTLDRRVYGLYETGMPSGILSMVV